MGKNRIISLILLLCLIYLSGCEIKPEGSKTEDDIAVQGDTAVQNYGDTQKTFLNMAGADDFMLVLTDPISKEYLAFEVTAACMVDTHLAEDDERILFVPLKDDVHIIVDIVKYDIDNDDYIVQENIADFFADTNETAMLFAPIIKGVIPNIRVLIECSGMIGIWFNSHDMIESSGKDGVQWLTAMDLWTDKTEDRIFYIIENLCEETMRYFMDGMTALCTGDYELVDGEVCWKVAFGTDHDENFVIEIICAVGLQSTRVYRFDVTENTWVLCNNFVVSSNENIEKKQNFL